MSLQRENVIPFVVDSRSSEIPLEAEFAYVVGVVGDKLKKGGFFKRSKERLTQVSKFYWRIVVDSINHRIVLIDSLGLYGGGTGLQDLSLTNVFAQLKALQDASTLKAYVESLHEANSILILETTNYPLFNRDFTRSTVDLVRKTVTDSMIDTPLILPTFDQALSQEIIDLLNETPRFSEVQDQLQELAHYWLSEINSQIENIERNFADRIARIQDEVENRIQSYKEKMDETIDTNLERANQAVFRELSKFESSTLGLTGMISPIQEHARNIINEVASLETPRFQSNMKSFLTKSKEQIENISGKVKELENNRKKLAKTLNAITQDFMTRKDDVVKEYETKKAKAEDEVDTLRMSRDNALSNLTEMRESIKENTDAMCKKLQNAVNNRKEVINKSTLGQGGDVPSNIILSLYLIKFQDRDDVRYYVIPPLMKPRGGLRSPDYPNANMDSAIKEGKQAADKLAEELVFNRRLKSSFDALRATNYLATSEFVGAVRQGLEFLIQNNMISKRSHKKIIELLDNLDL